MGLSGESLREPSLADCQVCNLPLVVGADQSPPGKARVSKPGAGLFHPENSERPDILLANPGYEKHLPDIEGTRPRPDSVSWQPLHSMAAQCLPTCCCNPLGTLELHTGSAHTRCTNKIDSYNHMTHRCGIHKGHYALTANLYPSRDSREKHQATLKYDEA
jgi:hypothetical protein